MQKRHVHMRRLLPIPALLTCLFVVPPEAQADAKFWLSTSSSASAPPSPGSTPDIGRPLNAPGTIHVWVRPELDETLTPKILSNFSLNLISTDDDVLEFTQVEVHNGLNDGATRFEFLFDSLNGLNVANQAVCFPDLSDPTAVVLPDQALWGIRGFSVSNGAGNGLGTDTANDPNYDALNNAWLLATVSYAPLQQGITELFLQIGEVGMNHPGETTNAFDASFGDPSDATLNAEADRCVNSATREARVTITAPLIGDFNNNGVLDGDDVDLLSDEIRAATNSAAFNLTGVEEVNAADRVFWVETLAETFFGDANLDQTVAFDDFLRLSSNYLMAGTWSSGDFTGDRLVGFDDFLLLSDNYLNTAVAVAAVPEPAARMPFLLGALPIAFLLARRAR